MISNIDKSFRFESAGLGAGLVLLPLHIALAVIADLTAPQSDRG